MSAFRITALCILFSLTAAVTGYSQDTLLCGVRTVFSAEKKMFPSRWTHKKVGARATFLAGTAIPRATAVVSRALSRYPDGFPDRYLDRIYVLQSLQFYGYPYGGSFTKKTVYLAFDETNPLNTDRYLEERFHHEFSSILWIENRKLLDLEKWSSFNPEGFVYGEGGLDAIRNGTASMETDPGYFPIGFINRYAMTEIEQDINVAAQNLFCGGPEFWRIVDENERIRGKVMLLIGFYQALDPVFTESYFRTID